MSCNHKIATFTVDFVVDNETAQCSEVVLMCQTSMNVMEPMSVICCRRLVSMSQGPTAAVVYPASTVKLAADLATVASLYFGVFTFIGFMFYFLFSLIISIYALVRWTKLTTRQLLSAR